MSKQISNLLQESQASFNAQRTETKGLVTKWEKTGLLEGVDAEYDRHNTAILLENQAKQLISENNTTAAANDEWNGVALPLVRRIFGEIAAKDFVSVQPMNLPSGLVFWLDFKYGGNKLGDATNGFRHAKGTDIAGNTSGSKPTGGLYGRGTAGYSLAPQKIGNDTTCTIASASWGELGFDADLSASVVAGTVIKVTIPKASIPTDFDQTVVASVAVSSSLSSAMAYDEGDNLPAYNHIDGSGNLVIFSSKDATGGDDTDTELIYSPMGATAASRGDFEDASATSADNSLSVSDLKIPQIDVALRSETLLAKTRKLKVVWTPEFAQDLNAYHSIDAEAELTSMLSEYISMEIDLEILEMVSNAALFEETWSAKIGETAPASLGAGIGVSSVGMDAATTGMAYTQMSWFQTLGTKLQKVSNKIHAATMRGGANFLVASPDVCTILESLNGFNASTDGTAANFAMGVNKVGAVNNRYTVYKNPYWQDNVMVMGFRGSQFLETGAVYAPYIPLIMTPLVYDPTNFTPRKGVMTRYAKKVVRPEFYGKLKVAGLNAL